MRIVLMIAVITTALAGCTGDDGASGDGPDDNTTAPPGSDGNGTTLPGDNNTTLPPPGANNTTEDGNGSANVTWAYDNRSGEVSGDFLIVTGPEAVEESVSVSEGSLMLIFNISVEGDDLLVRIAPPGCEDESCEQSVDASAGNASFEQAAPDAGDWRVIFEPDGGPVGGFAATYNLSIAVAVPSSGA